VELTKEQKYIILALIGILLSGLFYSAYNHFFKPSDSEIFVADSVKKEDSISSQSILVHVSGAVRTEGVFKLKNGSRLLDAIRASGGFLPKADPSKLNLAQELKDGTKIAVPFKVGLISVVPAAGDEAAGSAGLVNINSASPGELVKIPGVGEVTAKRIVEYRKDNGSFSAPGDLKKVKGIGPKKFEKMKEHVTVN
jgi:competence protein ComEA